MSDGETGATGPDGDDIGLPKTTVHKMVQGHLTDGMTCPKDAKDLIAECAKEFITLIASEANELCEKSAKKMMMPDHVVQALKGLGYESYAAPVEEVMQENTAAVKSEKARKVNKAEQSGMTEEELAAEQERLFAASREQFDAGEA